MSGFVCPIGNTSQTGMGLSVVYLFYNLLSGIWSWITFSKANKSQWCRFSGLKDFLVFFNDDEFSKKEK